MGSNGLTAVENLRAKEKCPEHPSKRKFRTRALADAAAIAASERENMAIIAYACAGCGSFHLSRKVNGSDVVRNNDEPIVTPGMRSRALHAMPTVTVERSGDPTVYPPGNPLAKDKVFADFIELNPGPVRVATVMEVLDCGVETARETLRRAGFTARRGPGAKWEPPTVDEEQSTVEAEWQTPSSFPTTITIDQYAKVLDGLGLTMRIQVRPKGR